MKIIKIFAIKSKTNEGYSSRLIVRQFEGGTIVIEKIYITKIKENHSGHHVIRAFNNYEIRRTFFSIKERSLVTICKELFK
jgi:hypothetical protein